MTRESEDLTQEDKVVVFFDICSSTSILEDLLPTGNLAKQRNMILVIRDFLRTRSAQDRFIPYKFTGDGWVLLFPADVSGSALINFMTRLSAVFSKHFRDQVSPFLQKTPNVVGLRFGVDRGTLIHMVMNEQDEYIGRPLNVAARLQDAIKDKEKNDNPAYKALFTKPAFNSLNINKSLHTTDTVTRILKNIRADQEVELVMVSLNLAGKSLDDRELSQV